MNLKVWTKHHALLPQWKWKEILETKTQNFWITVFLNFQQEMGLKDRVICSNSHGAVEVSLLQLVLVNHRTSHDWILKRCAVSAGKAHTIELFFPRGVGGLYTGIQTVNANVFGLQDESLSHFCKGSFIPRKKSSPLWKVPFNLYLPGKHRNPCHYFRQQSTGF